MKKLITALMLCMSLVASASDSSNIPVINLDSGSIQLPNGSMNGDQFILVRTATTPEEVTLFTNGIPANQLYCAQYATRMVWGQHPSCGTDVRYVYRCDRDRYGRTYCHYVPVYYTRSCYYPETYCAQYATRQIQLNDSFTLKFKSKGVNLSDELALKATLMVVGDGSENPRTGNTLYVDKAIPGSEIKIDDNEKHGSGRKFDIKIKGAK